MSGPTPSQDHVTAASTGAASGAASSGDRASAAPGVRPGSAGAGGPAPDARPGSLRARLAGPGAFVTLVELVPWRGVLDDEGGRRARETAARLAEDPRIAAVSVTDNAGGHAMASPEILGRELLGRGQEVMVHVACRDRNRNELLSLGWRLGSAGFENVLCLSGDYPVAGYGGVPRPVFDLDSVALLAMYTDLAAGRWPTPGDRGGGHGGGGAKAKSAGAAGPTAGAAGPTAGDGPVRPRFHLGAVVNNHKRFEREVVPQYLKLALKVRAGAQFVISQVGYDARKQDELIRWMRARDLRVPAVANAFILTRGVARAFHDGRIPGCTVTDELLAVAEREGASPDKGKAFFLELAAKQAAIARGLGYAGIYLGGSASYDDFARILDIAATFGQDDWRTFAADVRFGQPGEFYAFEADPATGLSSDVLDRRYARRVRKRSPRGGWRRAPLSYTVDRHVHEAVFAPGSAGFRLGARVYAAAERHHLMRPLHVLEQAVKIPLYDCRDCGDCSLPDVAYLCPESQCAKNQRNGPCGGTHDGECEVPGRECIWARAYERLSAYGAAETMLDRPPVITDNALRRTSAWANAFLERDHSGRLANQAKEG